MVKELLKLPVPLWNGEELSGRHIVVFVQTKAARRLGRGF
jgi:hypothetical protein